jgi:hypothetical protein
MHKRSSVIVGTIFIVVGLLFLLIQLFPGLGFNLDMDRQWPLIIVSVGGLLVLSAFLGSPRLAIPGSITAGIGGILYVQNLTNTWASWAYIWTLIPGFVAIGLILAGFLGYQRRASWRAGSRLLLISATLFLLIGLGLWMLLPRRQTPNEKL